MTDKNTDLETKKDTSKGVTAPASDSNARVKALLRTAKGNYDPDTIIGDLDKDLQEYYDSKEKGKEKETKLKAINEKYSTAAYIYALENHYAAKT